MDNKTIASLLSSDGYIQVNKELIKSVGLAEAIIVGELCAEYNYWQINNLLEDDKLANKNYLLSKAFKINVKNDDELIEKFVRIIGI